MLWKVWHEASQEGNTIFCWFLSTLNSTLHACPRLRRRKLTPPSNSSHMVMQPHPLLHGNKDDLDDSDHLSSQSVLTTVHCTALYASSICAIQTSVVCIWMVHTQLECTPDEAYPPLFRSCPRIVPAGKFCLKLIVPAAWQCAGTYKYKIQNTSQNFPLHSIIMSTCWISQ